MVLVIVDDELVLSIAFAALCSSSDGATQQGRQARSFIHAATLPVQSEVGPATRGLGR